jgi:hypothetical protein
MDWKEQAAEHPADLLQGPRPDVVEKYYDEGGALAYHTENGKQYARWENEHGGVIISYSGMTSVWMRISDPGVYYNAAGAEVSERDAQRAGFNVQYWRDQRRAAAIQQAAKSHADRIRSESAEHLKTPEDKRAERTEALRVQAQKATAKVEHEYAKQVQAAADRQRTAWLQETPPA